MEMLKKKYSNILEQRNKKLKFSTNARKTWYGNKDIRKMCGENSYINSCIDGIDRKIN